MTIHTPAPGTTRRREESQRCEARIRVVTSLVCLQTRALAANGFHFVGACPVGQVLDGELRVLGFTNLRVVDASAIPDLPPSSGPMSSVFMIAEFMAQHIIDTAAPTKHTGKNVKASGSKA